MSLRGVDYKQRGSCDSSKRRDKKFRNRNRKPRHNFDYKHQIKFLLKRKYIKKKAYLHQVYIPKRFINGKALCILSNGHQLLLKTYIFFGNIGIRDIRMCIPNSFR